MAENVPESVYFPHDREQLLNTLARFDDGLRVEDVVGPENVAYDLRQHSNTLLLQVFLEFICHAFVRDENQREILLMEACKRLSKSKILNQTLVMKKSNPLRKIMKQNVVKFLEQVCQDVMPNVELDSTAVSLFQNECISADLQLFYCENFDELRKIGQGGFGSVYKAEYKLNKIIYAVKKIPFVYKNDTCFLTVMREANNFATLSHPNIVRYHSAWIEIENSDSVNKSPSHANVVSDVHDKTKHSGFVIKHTPPSSSDSLRAKDFKNDPNIGAESESDSIIFSESAVISKDVNWSVGNCSQNYSNEDNDSVEMDTYEDNKYFESESDSIIFSESAEIPKDVDWSVGNSSQNFSNHSDEDDETIEDNSPNDKKNVLNETNNEDNSLSNLNLQGILYIQMEYCDCDLSFWLFKRAETKGKELPFEMDVHEIFLDIVKGVHHIHSKNIIHRDLKPHNIFYSKAFKTIKIGDFGLATLAGFTDSSNYESLKHSTDVGTHPYAAPEQKTSKYDTKADMYSLGIILIELINVCVTRTELGYIIEAMKDGQVVEGMKKFPVLGKLAKNLISDNPKMRKSAKEIINLIDRDAKAILKEVVVQEFMVESKKIDDKINALDKSFQSIQEDLNKMKSIISRQNLEQLARQNSELLRKNSELIRKNSELMRQNSELMRQNSEVSRQNSEVSRQNSEVSRQNSEVSRQNLEIAKLDKVISEKSIESE